MPSIQVQEIPYQGYNGLPLVLTDRTDPVPEPLAIKCNDLEYQCDALGIEAIA
jgi:hypothetical protein